MNENSSLSKAVLRAMLEAEKYGHIKFHENIRKEAVAATIVRSALEGMTVGDFIETFSPKI